MAAVKATPDQPDVAGTSMPADSPDGAAEPAVGAPLAADGTGTVLQPEPATGEAATSPLMDWRQVPAGPVRPLPPEPKGAGTLSAPEGTSVRVDDVVIAGDPTELGAETADRARHAAWLAGITLKEHS